MRTLQKFELAIALLVIGLCTEVKASCDKKLSNTYDTRLEILDPNSRKIEIEYSANLPRIGESLEISIDGALRFRTTLYPEAGVIPLSLKFSGSTNSELRQESQALKKILANSKTRQHRVVFNIMSLEVRSDFFGTCRISARSLTKLLAVISEPTPQPLPSPVNRPVDSHDITPYTGSPPRGMILTAGGDRSY